MDWNRQKRICESTNWLFIVKESRNFGNYIKIWSQIENNYGINWICWFQVFFNTLHQHNKCVVKHLKSTNSAHSVILSQNNMVPLLYRDGIRKRVKHYLFYLDYTEKGVLEGVDVGILWSYVIVVTGVPGGKPLTLDRQPLPCHKRTSGVEPELQQWQARFSPCTIYAPKERVTFDKNLTSHCFHLITHLSAFPH